MTIGYLLLGTGGGDGGGAEQKMRRNCGIKEGSREPEEHAPLPIN